MNRRLLVSFSMAAIFATYFTCQVSADIVRVSSSNGSATFGGVGGTTVGPTAFSVNLANSNTLAVMLSSESINNFSVTYDGTSLVAGSSAVADLQFVQIFYLLNNTGATSGNLAITGTSNTTGTGTAGLAYSVFELSGVGSVATTFPNPGPSSLVTPVPNSLSANYTTVSNGGFILAGAVDNASSLANTPTYTSGGRAISTEQRIFLLAGGSGHTHQYGTVATAGSYTETFGTFTGRSAVAILPFEASAIPEPGSLGMLCLGSTLLLARRRRVA